MNKHIEKAMELRNETPMVSNCSQTIMRCTQRIWGFQKKWRQDLAVISVVV